LGEYPGGEVQLANNKSAQSLNFPDGKTKTILSYFKTKKTKTQQEVEGKKELQAKQEAYKSAIIQIILSHHLCMLNCIFCCNSF